MQYSTSFPATENPLSEGGTWICGNDASISNSGLNGVQVQSTTATMWEDFDGVDGIALLTTTYGTAQTVEITVKVNNANKQEVELYLNSFFTVSSPSNLSGYEIDIVNNTLEVAGGAGFNFVRWDHNSTTGGSITFLVGGGGTGGAMFDFGRFLVTGDKIKVVNDGSNNFSFYLNETLLTDARFPFHDTTYTGGHPGLGFFFDVGSSPTNDNDFVITAFSANDGVTPPPPTPTILFAQAAM